MLQNLIQELKRRRVFRAAAVYAVVGWALIQAADTIFPTLEMPDWTVRLVVLLVLLGFPIALVLSWAFDFTTSGLRRADEPPPSPQSAGSGRPLDRILKATGAAVVITLVGFAGYAQLSGRGGDSADLRSIAVLPFVNMSEDQENEYFSDGLSEELLNALVKVPSLSVAARTSSFAYKGKTQNIRQIARELGVATVLEGSVRKSGDRVRITAQLVRADNGYHLWSETYDRQLNDIFVIQEEIARSITEALQLQLGAAQPQLVRRGTQSIEAYDLYLKGRYALSSQKSEERLRQAVQFFQQAIARDSAYGLAYAGLADAYVELEDYLPLDQVAPLARSAALRAIALDDSRAETYTALGHVAMHYDFDWAATARAYQRAVELAPNASGPHGSLSHLYFASGKYEDGLSELRRALELARNETVDKSAFEVRASAGLAHGLLLARRFDQAVEQAQRTLGLDPRHRAARRDLATALLARGEVETGLEHARQVAPPEPGLLAYALARAGLMTEARAQLAQLSPHGSGGHHHQDYDQIALVHLGLGDTNQAIAAFEQAYHRRDPGVLHVRLNPLFDPLWQQPRFVALMKKAGVPLR